MLNQITPVILTYNEAPNIGRVLDRLSWAERIVVVDSVSTDETLDILSRYDSVVVHQRKFNSHAEQWNFAIGETGIETDWVLALDADYGLTDEVIKELEGLSLDGAVSGYRAFFLYCVFGKPLRGTLYPPVTVLYRRENAHYIQDGHTQRIVIEGEVEDMLSPILHDDRKPLSSWLQAQDRYMNLEADIISNSAYGELGFNDRVRKFIFIAPALTFFYCLFFKLGVLDGWRGLYYATQRALAELILSLKLIERIIK
ncbi:MAG: glycosyltransferase family 2 protein [Gammaproteobacteria bacterium]|nr:glycosyltransferase family 2 protein [Gammaproteobacteria bacterium]